MTEQQIKDFLEEKGYRVFTQLENGEVVEVKPDTFAEELAGV